MKLLQIKKRSLGILLLVIGQLFINSAWAQSNSAAARQKRIEDLKQELNTINYGSKDPKAIVYVFTDLNCDFCRKLHHEFQKLGKLGVQVRVMAMPRQGLGSPGYNELVSIWCSKDPNDSLERGMEGEEIAPKTCKNPVKTHYNLGMKWGIIGTPTVVFEDGTLKAGFFTADKLAKEAMKRTPEKQASDKETPKVSGTGEQDKTTKTGDGAKKVEDKGKVKEESVKTDKK